MNKSLFLCVAVLSGLVQHAAAVQINLDTPRTELTLKPGQTKRVRIKLTNHEERPVRMRALLQDVEILPDGSPEFSAPGSTAWSLKELVSSALPAFALGGRSQRTIGVQITAPQNAKGGWYGAVIFESEPVKSRAAGGGLVNVNLRLAALLLITIKDTEVLKAEIKDLKAWRENGQVKVRLSVANTGNVLIRPQGQIRVRNAASTVDNVLNAAKIAVLPGQEKDYLVQVPEPAAGRKEIEAELDFGGKEIAGARVVLE